MIAFCGLVLADEAAFVRAYDAGDFREAARLNKAGLDTKKPEIARRLGVMYHEGKGVPQNPEKGCKLLEQAMAAGDVTAALNLVKIYHSINTPKAAWCLMVANSLSDETREGDIARLRRTLGTDWISQAVSYTSSFREALSSEIDRGKKNAEVFQRERNDLANRLAAEREVARQKAEADAQEREKLVVEKSQIEKDKKRLETVNGELEKELAASKTSCKEVKEKLEVAELGCAGIENLRLEISSLTALRSELEKRLAASESMVSNLQNKLTNAEKKAKESKYLTGLVEGYKEADAKSTARITELENDLVQLRTELKNVRSSAAEERANDMTSLRAVRKKLRERCIRYNALMDRYNDLVRKYNSSFQNSDSDSDVVRLSDNSFLRACGVFILSPCNFLRTFPAASAMYDRLIQPKKGSQSKKRPSENFARLCASISIPLIFCGETVPTACDLVNGAVDMLTLGTYGDWLYSGDLEPCWYKRDNTHFPWLDR